MVGASSENDSMMLTESVDIWTVNLRLPTRRGLSGSRPSFALVWDSDALACSLA